MEKMEITFLGTNGSCAYNNSSRVKYGSNNLCVAVNVGGQSLIFDAGSGIGGYQRLADSERKRLHLFFSHYHTDHLQGLLFFAPVFDREKHITFYGMEAPPYADVRPALDAFLSPPWHPVGLAQFQAALAFSTLRPGDCVALPGAVTVRVCRLSHPNGSLGYRVEHGGKAFCYCTDVELSHHQDDDALLAFTQGADLVVFDSHFDEGKLMPGWGHSSWKECALWAARAEAKRLALFHYNYTYSDAEIDRMEEQARAVFPGAFASADGMRVTL